MDDRNWVVLYPTDIVELKDANVLGSLTQGEGRFLHFASHDAAARVSEAMTETTGLPWGIKAI